MHAGIPSWLQSEIEGFSQFSRLPGLDPTRVILCHTNFGQGDRKHHVFSRIHDCGADYTGRTNHIAHHFIFTAAEIAQATKLGVTPVDVLAYLKDDLWKTAWSGDPAILQPDEELPIISIPKNRITLPAINYWGHLCPDHPEYAAVLAPGKLSEACWLIYPTGWSEPIIYALGESLLLHTNPWAVTFTNNLQPTDNEQLFSWRCIPSDSPLLEKATSSVRPCIDLSNPLPFLSGVPNEFLEQARTGKKPLPKPRSVETALSPLGNIPTTRPAGINIPSPTPSLRPSAPEAGPKVALRSATTKPRKQKNPALVIVSLALASVLLLGGSYFFKQKFEADKKRELESIRESENENTLNSWGNISPNSSVDKTTLKQEDYDKIEKFIESFNDKNWEAVNSVINRDFVTEKLKSAMEAKIKQWQMHEYSKLSRLEDFSKVDINDLKNYINFLENTEKERWNKAIALLNYLKDTQNASDPFVTKDLLPSGENEQESQKLLEAYYDKKKLTPPEAATIANIPIVQTNRHPPPAKETPIPTPTPKPVPVVNTDPPIYVFFKKPADYRGLKPKRELESGENYKVLTNNSTLATLTDAIKNATDENGAIFEGLPEKPPFFVVLNKDKCVKHIVLNLDKSFLQITRDYNPISVYEIKGETFRFSENFLKTLSQLKDGEKILEGKTEAPDFTFTWELKVKDHAFLKSSGTISSNDLPSIKKADIDARNKTLDGNMITAKTTFLESVQKYDEDFNEADHGLDSIIEQLIDNRKKESHDFFSVLAQKIEPQKNDKKNSKYEILPQIATKDTKNMADFLKNFNALKGKKTDEKEKIKLQEKIKKEWENLGNGLWDEIELTKKFKFPNNEELKKELRPSYDKFVTAKKESSSLGYFGNKTELPIELILSCSSQRSPGVFMTLKIDNFPITTSKLSGGQQ